MINYTVIKSLAGQRGLRVSDLIALAPKNDPFYVNPNSQKMVRAEWFAALWKQFGYTDGVHLRRMHYQIVSQAPPLKRPDGLLYENTQRDWGYLNEASKWARYQGLVSPTAFVDRRNPDAIISAHWQSPDDEGYADPTPAYTVSDYFDEHDFYLPELPELETLPDEILKLPDFAITGYASIEQPYHIELWCEKTTMNDVLLPLCQTYGANLITGAGEMSITAVVDFLQRTKRANRPARILYISDFDPAGLGMPISVARKIEYFQRNEGWGNLDIRLHPIVLNAEQVAQYNLPRVPVKNTDLRKANFEAHHGKGQVELDALEALHPGALTEIVETAILQYYDASLQGRAIAQRNKLAAALAEKRETILGEYTDDINYLRADYQALLDEFEATREKFTELTSGFQPEIDAYAMQLNDLTDRAQELNEQLTDDLSYAGIDTDDFPLPDPDLTPPDGLLYESQRDYVTQLRAYKSQQLGE